MDTFVEIKDKKQLDEFMDHIWNFHDSVISKIDYVSGSFGSQEGAYPIDDKRELKYQLLLLEIFTFRKVFFAFSNDYFLFCWIYVFIYTFNFFVIDNNSVLFNKAPYFRF